MMRARKPREGEIVFDLGKHLPAGRQFWWPSEVDKIVAMLQYDVVSDVVRSVSHEVGAKSHPNYQVLHVALAEDASRADFLMTASAVIHIMRIRRNHERV